MVRVGAVLMLFLVNYLGLVAANDCDIIEQMACRINGTSGAECIQKYGDSCKFN